MSWPDIYLLCFALGTIWSLATLLLGGLHIGHSHAGHGHTPGQAAHQHGHGGSSVHRQHETGSWFGSMANPNSLAIFLAWFGGVGYLLTRHTGFLLWIDLTIAAAFGLTGAWLLASFMRYLQAREKPLDPADYEMVGVLGRVSSTIRPEGVGEVIYSRDGARRPVCARSEEGRPIARGEEVIVTRFEKGIAFVRTWEAMTQTGITGLTPETLPRETKNVE